jgi:ubiquinone biosynthesis monooxygenase Coq7
MRLTAFSLIGNDLCSIYTIWQVHSSFGMMVCMNIDISIIRPEVHLDDIKLRREKLPTKELRQLRKALRAFHTLETMAANIYKFQITRHQSEHNRLLIAAMGNEMTHLQDFQMKLYEYGLKPSKIRFRYWAVGFFIGFFSRLLGEKAILKAGIWVERKAVHHYKTLLGAVEWQQETRAVILKNQADEAGHISRWMSLLSKSQTE